jgi:uncharacterized protein GlcG (DUF336 family)
MRPDMMKTCLFVVMLGSVAFAQAPLAAPPATPYGLSIAPDAAKKAASAAIAEALKNKWNMALAVVDTGGYLVYFERTANAQLGSVDLAIEKAKTATLFRRPTKTFQDALASGGDNLRILRLTGTIPVDGGIPIVVDGKIIGALGVSGGSSDQDGRVAEAGVNALK